MEQTTRPGGSVTFICYASIPRDTPRPGDVVLHFQWLRSGEAITPLSPKQNVLTLENVSLQDDGATFVCCVSDGKKMTQSMPARLTVTTKSGGKGSSGVVDSKGLLSGYASCKLPPCIYPGFCPSWGLARPSLSSH